MNRRRGLLIFLIVLILVAVGYLPKTFYAAGPIHTQLEPNKEVWRIDEPPVDGPRKDYPEIRFRKGDVVKVEAGGCVQTGGGGKTWKRYVDPEGDNTDRLYFGQIWIPGTQTGTPGLVPIRNIVGQELSVTVVPEHDQSNMYLRLGYPDDDYNGNGYSDHDDGNNNQCKDVGNAWVLITITHGVDAGPNRPGAMMDLWWNAVDDNALPLNAMWGYQVAENGTSNGLVPDAKELCNHFHDEGDFLNLGRPPCTTQRPTVDEPSVWSDLLHWGLCQFDHLPGTVHGHINWGYGSYTGKIYFEDFQNPLRLQDNDYDMALIRDKQEGVTTGNTFRYHAVGPLGLGVEFDTRETIDRFRSPWWVAFHRAVDADATEPFGAQRWLRAQALVDGKQAIVIGLIGIDNQHEPRTELHPTYAMAIHVTDNPCDDVWAVFVRNWGNEGYCSQDQHYLPLEQVNLFFPDVTAVDSSSVLYGDTSISSWGAKLFADGALCSIKLATPERRSIVHGELHFKRLGPCASPDVNINHSLIAELPVRQGARMNAETLRFAQSINLFEPEYQDDSGPLWDALTPGQRSRLSSRLRIRTKVYRRDLAKEVDSQPTLVRNDEIVPTVGHGSLKDDDDRRLREQVAPEFDRTLAEERRATYELFKQAVGGQAKAESIVKNLLRTAGRVEGSSLARTASEPRKVRRRERRKPQSQSKQTREEQQQRKERPRSTKP